MKYICTVCGYVHDDSVEATPFHQLSDDYVCPVCGADKDAFKVVE